MSDAGIKTGLQRAGEVAMGLIVLVALIFGSIIAVGIGWFVWHAMKFFIAAFAMPGT